MPKFNNTKHQISKIQQIIKQYTLTTKSIDQIEKRAHINNIVNHYKLNPKNKRYINQWVNNNFFQQQQQQQTKFEINVTEKKRNIKTNEKAITSFNNNNNDSKVNLKLKGIKTKTNGKRISGLTVLYHLKP